jgi:hypothetical protein
MNTQVSQTIVLAVWLAIIVGAILFYLYCVNRANKARAISKGILDMSEREQAEIEAKQKYDREHDPETGQLTTVGIVRGWRFRDEESIREYRAEEASVEREQQLELEHHQLLAQESEERLIDYIRKNEVRSPPPEPIHKFDLEEE